MTDGASGSVLREETDVAGVRRHVPVLSSELAGPPPDSAEVTGALLEDALGLGCSGAGIFTVDPFAAGAPRLEAWLEAGHHGTMSYLEAAGRSEPRSLLEAARAGLVVALPYGAGAPGLDEGAAAVDGGDPAPATGRIAKYARGADYHHTLRAILLELADRAALHLRRPVLARVCVDTAPLLEREATARAGLAFIGKNTMAILPGGGSYVLLGELLLDAELAPEIRVRSARRGRQPAPSGCGACTACLDACPTGAFLGPHTLDARRCISYLTIEYAGVIPEELRSGIGAHVFGCDICQDVCPFNRSAHARSGERPLGQHPHLEAPVLTELLELTSSGYRRFVTGTALRRVSRARLARNAAVALGNVGDDRALGPLTRAVLGHPSELVRGHAAWALGQVLGRGPRDRGGEARGALATASAEDPLDWVRDEARRAQKHAEGAQATGALGPRRLPLA